MLDRLIDLAGAEHRADRLVAGAQALGDAENIGCHAVRLAGKQMPGAAHAAHHLVQDQQHAVLVADLADALEITLNRRHRAGCGADHRLRHKGHHGLGTKAEDFRLQLIRHPLAVVIAALALSPAHILIAGRDMGDVDQQRRELGTAPFIAACRQRTEGVAVVALLAGDDMAALRLAALQVVLAGELDRGLGGLRPAGDEIDPVDVARCVGHQQVCQLFRRFRGEEAGMGKGQLADLLLHRLDHIGVGMAQAGHCSAAGAVEIALAVRVDQIAAVTGNSGGQAGFGVAGKDMTHDQHSLSVWPWAFAA